MASACSSRNVAILEATLAIHPKASVYYHVSLSTAEISYSRSAKDGESFGKSAQHVIQFCDVIGADCMRGKTSDCPTAYLNVYAYPHAKKFARKASLRRRLCMTFMFARFTSFDENHKDAAQWQLVISHLVRGSDVPPQGNYHHDHPLFISGNTAHS